MADLFLDVSELEPPEPLQKIVEALSALSPGQRLIVKHRREPCQLYPILQKNGFQYELNKKSEDHFEFVIWR